MFQRALRRSRARITGALAAIIPGRGLDAEAADELEAALLASDVGPALTAELMEAVRRDRGADAGVVLGAAMKDLLARSSGATLSSGAARPRVVLVVGVNGSGKTTTVAKLARYHSDRGEKVLLGAADTFRAAAVEQLQTWGQRVGVDVVAQTGGGDPAAVAFDACTAAVARGCDRVLIDTAGRLHTQSNLMGELTKLHRVLSKVVSDAPHDVLLVLDGTTGQNGLRQAEEFLEHAGVTGVVLTKLDGTARGGVALAIARRVGLPIHFVGTGEGDTDLAEFDATEYVHGLLGL